MEHPRCLDCHYQLRGLSEPRCPECGREYDPKDPTTYWLRSTSLFGRTLFTKPSRSGNWLFTIATIFVVYAKSEPLGFQMGWSCCSFFLLMPALLIFGAWWIAKTFTYFRVMAISREFAEEKSKFWSRRWLTVPVCVVIAATCMISRPWPLTVRFHLSRPAFEQAVKDLGAGKPIQNQWIGLYYVRYVMEQKTISGQTAYEFYTGNFAFDSTGFKYVPGPKRESYRGFFPVSRFWYVFIN